MCGHSRNAGLKFFSRNGKKFLRQCRKMQSVRKKICNHKYSTTREPCVTVEAQSKAARLQHVDVGTALQYVLSCAHTVNRSRVFVSTGRRSGLKNRVNNWRVHCLQEVGTFVMCIQQGFPDYSKV